MRLSAALFVTLLAVSAAAGTGAGSPAGIGAGPPAEIGAGPPAETGASLPASPAVPTDSAGPTDPSTAIGPANETTQNVTVHDGTEMFVSLRENGDARWNVSFRFVLHGRNETEAFRRLADRYRSGNAEVGYSQETFEHVVELAGSDTAREMELRRVNRSARLLDNGSAGVLSLSFTWTNFTQTDPEANEIALGDVFWVDEQTWLPTLSDDQRLVIAGPEEYYISGASPSGGTISGTVLRYEGPQRFESGDFSLTYSPKVAETTAPETPDTPDGGLPISGTSGVLLVVLLFGFSFGAYALAQRRRSADPDAVEASDDGVASPPRSDGEVGDAADEAGPGSEARSADAVGSGGETGPDGGESADPDGEGEGDEDESDDDRPATELLSDEERVLRLLRGNDGRMKQAQIVKETNWSNAKVSQLLSKMDDDDEVDKLRIGRENLITLPDEDVTDTD